MRDDISPKIEVLNVYVPSSFQDDDNIKRIDSKSLLGFYGKTTVLKSQKQNPLIRGFMWKNP